MVTPLRVSCVNRTGRSGVHECIQRIGGLNAHGAEWWLPASQAIQGIKENRWSFYVEAPDGLEVNLVVIGTHLGREYLTTEIDGQQPTDLLALPECPTLPESPRY